MVGILYNKLEDADSIRLLSVLPKKGDDLQIECSMLTAHREHDLKYSVVSYARSEANPETDKQILLNGELFTVSIELWSALANIRKYQRQESLPQDLLLWVNTICINQEDIGEKNDQVTCVPETLANAGNVLIWLGQRTALNEPFRALPWASNPVWRTGEQDRTKHARHRNLYQILLNRYWLDIWAMQELCLPKTLTIITPRELFREDSLQEVVTRKAILLRGAVAYWTVHGCDLRPSVQAVSVMRRFDSWMRLRKLHHNIDWVPHTLFQLVSQVAEDSQCWDLRDKIFAMQGMTNQRVKVDYAISIPQLFWEIVRMSDLIDVNAIELDIVRKSLKLSWAELHQEKCQLGGSHDTVFALKVPVEMHCLAIRSQNHVIRKLRSNTDNTVRVNADFNFPKSNNKFSMQFLLLQDKESYAYAIKEAFFCPEMHKPAHFEVDLTGCTIEKLDQRWENKKESFAVDPVLFTSLICLDEISGSMDRYSPLTRLKTFWPDVKEVDDAFFEVRETSLRYGSVFTDGSVVRKRKRI